MKLNPNQSWGNFLKAAKYYSSTPAKEEYIARSKLGLSDFEIIMCNGDYKEALKMLLEKIEKAPAADVVEVVRCRDCVHRPEAPNGATSGVDVEAPHDEAGWRDETCPYLCGDHWYNTIPQDEWFCHHGERKKNA